MECGISDKEGPTGESITPPAPSAGRPRRPRRRPAPFAGPAPADGYEPSPAPAPSPDTSPVARPPPDRLPAGPVRPAPRRDVAAASDSENAAPRSGRRSAL